jgi:hypothetical protein
LHLQLHRRHCRLLRLLLGLLSVRHPRRHGWRCVVLWCLCTALRTGTHAAACLVPPGCDRAIIIRICEPRGFTRQSRLVVVDVLVARRDCLKSCASCARACDRGSGSGSDSE